MIRSISSWKKIEQFRWPGMATQHQKTSRWDLENYMSVLGAPRIESPLSWKSKQELEFQKDPEYLKGMKLLVERSPQKALRIFQELLPKYHSSPNATPQVLDSLNSKYFL